MNKKLNKIDKLINELCPEGVESKELGEVLDYEQPTKYIVKSVKYDDNFETPVLTAGKNFILGYTNEDFEIYDAERNNPVIIFDDFTTSFHWVDFNFKVKSSAMKMIKPKENLEMNFRFIYYAMRCIGYEAQDHARHWISKYSKFKIPIPPLHIQKEIVKILDSFTELEAELEAELKARKKQYEYYRDELLSFDNGVEWSSLNEVCLLINAGGDLPKNYKKGQNKPTKEFPYPIFSNGSNEKALYGYTDNYKIDKAAVTISARGTIGYHALRLAKFTPIVRLITLIPNTTLITPKFLNYVLDMASIFGTDGGIPQLTVPTVKKIKIPVPSLSEQKRIVAILDKFDALVNDISIGLPAELSARRKQYEYYREKLLTFNSITN